jgi:hypothetical protein
MSHHSSFHYKCSLSSFLNQWEHIPITEWTKMSSIPPLIPYFSNSCFPLLIPTVFHCSGNVVIKGRMPQFHSGRGLVGWVFMGLETEGGECQGRRVWNAWLWVDRGVRLDIHSEARWIWVVQPRVMRSRLLWEGGSDESRRGWPV